MNWARIYLGVMIIAVGTILFLGAADVLDAGEVLGAWWPVAVIGAGVLGLVANPRHWAIPAILTLGGVALLLWTTSVIDSLSVLVPVLVIVLGLFVLFGFGLSGARTVTGNRINSFNAFSGIELASHSPEFEGGQVGTIFGGTEIDLRDATLVPNASMDVFVAFGGVEVKVPEGWVVDLNGLPLFGGFENVTAREKQVDDAPKLEVHATALFGAVEVKH
jgi:hypothetical protein